MFCGPIHHVNGRGAAVSLATRPASDLTPRQMMQRALAVAIAKTRAAQAAKYRPMKPSEQEAFERYWCARTERSLRAKDAQKEKRRAARSRDGNDAPVQSGMWSKSMSCDAAGDTRLTMGARVALQIIRALTARGLRVSRSGLAVKLGVHPRSAQRYLAELRQCGYIRTRLIVNRLGWVIGQAIEITEKVLPKHHRPRIAANIADGLARCMSTRESPGSQGETDRSPSKSKYQTIPGGRGPYGLPVFVAVSP